MTCPRNVKELMNAYDSGEEGRIWVEIDFNFSLSV